MCFCLVACLFFEQLFQNQKNKQKHVNNSNRQNLNHVPIEKKHLLVSYSMEIVLDLSCAFALLFVCFSKKYSKTQKMNKEM